MIQLDKIKPEYLAELKRIQASVPEELLKSLVKTDKTPDKLKKAIARGADDPTNTEEVRRKCRVLVDSGFLEHEKKMVDKKVEKQIDAFIEEEIQKSIKRGTLPKRLKNSHKNIKRLVKTQYGQTTSA